MHLPTRVKGGARRAYFVCVSDGVGYKEFPCTDRHAYNEGIVYEYKNEKQQTDLVLVPHNYRYGQLDGKLLIGKRIGNSSAAVMVGDSYLIGHSVDKDAAGEDLSTLARTHVATIGYKSLYEKLMPLKWIIIIAAVGIAIFGIIWFIKSRGG